MEKRLSRAILLGIPNVGKSVLFNALCEKATDTGNWSGVTIKENSGELVLSKSKLEIVDLPGVHNIMHNVYSSDEEKRIYEIIRDDEFEHIIVVMEASSPKKSLYLLAQVVEIGKPFLVVVNRRGKEKDAQLEVIINNIRENLGINTVIANPNTKKGVNEIKEALERGFALSKRAIVYDALITSAIEDLMTMLPLQENRRWHAKKFIEGATESWVVESDIEAAIKRLREDIIRTEAEDTDLIMASNRYDFINKYIIGEDQYSATIATTAFCDKIDKIVLNRFLGIPILLCVIFAMLSLSIIIGGVFQDCFELVSRAIFIELPEFGFAALRTPKWLGFLIAGGFGGGMVVVATFIPVVFTVFLLIAILEETGYMARAAFVAHSFSRRIGLNGHAFVPLIISFGCNVPAVMASRILSNRNERIKTCMMAPFMSCSARLTVYALFCSAFFVHSASLVVFSLYLLGIIVAIFTALLLQKFMKSPYNNSFTIDLPRYRLPSIKIVFNKAKHRLESFVFGAGKTIVIIFMVVQMFNYYFLHTEGKSRAAELEQYGRIATKILTPMGVQESNWEATVAIITGILAKEVVIGTISALHNNAMSLDEKSPPTIISIKETAMRGLQSVPQNLAEIFSINVMRNISSYDFNSNIADEKEYDGLIAHLRKDFANPLAAYAYLVFILLYFPCMSVFGAIKSELGLRWALASAVWSTGIAYIVSVLIYRVGMLFL